MLGAPVILSGSVPVAAEPHAAATSVVEITSSVDAGTLTRDVQKAAAKFIRGMAEGDAESVWMFATEEEHDAFGTYDIAYDAFAEAFPVLTMAKSANFERAWQEGDTPFVELTVADSSGDVYRAAMGFWLDDAGDWKLVSCEVEPLSDRVAGL
jgi:hypothetical protein